MFILKTLVRLLVFIALIPLAVGALIMGIMYIVYNVAYELLPDKFWDWLMPSHEN